MKPTDKLLEQFMNLFRGYENAHGQHVLDGEADENGKIKGRASTKGTGAGIDQYISHLDGKGTSLGLVPLMADNTCWFGAIDIDIQGEVKLKEKINVLEKRIRSMELPLVVCQSKSGGAHLYFFAEKPISARLLTAKLAEFAATLGYGGAEIFPKQVTRVNEQDRGNWINISYYGVNSDPKQFNRYCIRNGKPILNLEDFLKYAFQMRYSSEALRTATVKLSDEFSDGPPCLQYLHTFGLEEGGRNNALTNVAIYLKKKYPDAWQDKVMEFNFNKVKPALSTQEVQQILKNVARKDYFYTCKIPPICNHCDKKLCAKREFGIDAGGGGELFQIDNLTKRVSKHSVRWYVEHQGHRIEVTTEELFNDNFMQIQWAEKFSKVVLKGKRQQYLEMLSEKMEACSIVVDPDDASEVGQFEALLDRFLTERRPGRNRDEIIKGNSYIDGDRIYFRSEDLFSYLAARRYSFDPHHVWTWVSNMGAEGKQVKIKGKNLWLWSIPKPEQFDNSKIELPKELDMEEM